MKVLLHPDGGIGVGLGHASRCASLAKALGRAGHEASVAVDPALELDEYLRRMGVPVTSSPADAMSLSRLADAMEADLVVIDSYKWQPSDFLELSRRTKVVAFDDIADRELPVDAVINGAPATERLSYNTLPHTRLWLGPSYQVVRDEFREEAKRPQAGPVRRMIVLVGGDDPLGLLPLLAARMSTLAATLPGLEVQLICGPYAKTAGVSGLPNIELVRHPDNLRQRMVEADLALSAAGQTLYELARCGTPTIVFCSGADQRHNLTALAQAGLVFDTGDATRPEWLQEVEQAVLQLAADRDRRQSMTERCQQLIDGRGADRLVALMEQLVR